MMQSWIETIDYNRALEIETRAMKAAFNLKHLQTLLNELPKKEHAEYTEQIKAINIAIKYLLSDISCLSFFQESTKYNTASLKEDKGAIEKYIKTSIEIRGNRSLNIRCILPQKGPKGLRTIDTHVGKLLEKDIEHFMKENSIEGPIFDKANVEMTFHFGKDIPKGLIPDPDNIVIKGILDALQMKIIKNDSLADISLKMEGKFDSDFSFLEIQISQKE